MKQILVLNPENASEEESHNFPVREAARAIVVDNEGNIALLHVSNVSYYKLPGGGLEGTEDRIIALERECQEEIGCDVEIIGEIGSIIEYRKRFNLKQISYCYFAKVKGEKGKPNYTDSEVAEGFETVWLPYEEAMRVIRENRATDLEGSAYIVPRDIAFLDAAKEYIENTK